MDEVIIAHVGAQVVLAGFLVDLERINCQWHCHWQCQWHSMEVLPKPDNEKLYF